MRVRTHDVLWIASGFAVALFAAVAILLFRGLGERGIVTALVVTARLAFLLFWPVYSAGALVTLFGATFQPLRAKARELGLAFTAALTVHLGLVGLLSLHIAPPALGVFLFFGGAAIFAYTLALFSFDPFRRALGAERWRLLSFLAMNYLAYAYIADFKSPLPYHGLKQTFFYLPFLLMSLAAPSLRLAAFCLRATRDWRAGLRRQT